MYMSKKTEKYNSVILSFYPPMAPFLGVRAQIGRRRNKGGKGFKESGCAFKDDLGWEVSLDSSGIKSDGLRHVRTLTLSEGCETTLKATITRSAQKKEIQLRRKSQIDRILTAFNFVLSEKKKN